MSAFHTIAAAWCDWVAAASLQVAILATAVLLLERLLGRHAWPQLLSGLWLLVLARMFVPPWLVSPLGLYSWPAEAEPQATGSLLEGPLHTSGEWIGLAFLAWLAGSGLIVAWGVRRHRRACIFWLHGSTAAPAWLADLAGQAGRRLGLSHVPPIRIQPAATGPAVVGVLRPAIVFPAGWLRDASRESWEHALLHELAHIRRRDPLWTWLLVGVHAAGWFHPAVWLACRRLATFREIACDEQAIAALQGRAQEYRRTLLTSARRALTMPHPTGLALIGQPCELLRRLAWLERPSARRTWRHATATLAACGIALVATLPGPGQANDSRSLEPARYFTEAPSSSSHIASPSTWEESLPTSTALADQPGCLPLRYFVLARLAEQESAIQP